jgi:hypothetical protein
VVVVGFPFLAFSGRQMALDVSDDTGLTRLQIWREGLVLFSQAPLLGIGQGQYADEAGMVAHNSFLHCYTELGMFGGTLFLGAFLQGFRMLFRMGAPGAASDAFLFRLRPYLSGMVAGTVIGMFSLSRAYSLPTYLMLALLAAYQRLAAVGRAPASLRFDGAFVRRSLIAGALFLMFTWLFVRVFVRWS